MSLFRNIKVCVVPSWVSPPEYVSVSKYNFTLFKFVLAHCAVISDGKGSQMPWPMPSLSKGTPHIEGGTDYIYCLRPALATFIFGFATVVVPAMALATVSVFKALVTATSVEGFRTVCQLIGRR